MAKRLSGNEMALFEWCRARGASFDALNFDHGDMGLSVFAARDISPDETMASIPRQLALGPTQAWESELGAAVKKSGVEVTDLMMLWVFMAHGRTEGTSDWGPYLRSLPQEPADIPNTWEEDFCAQELSGTQLFSQVQQERATMRDELAVLAPVLDAAGAAIGWSDILWANSMYRSRCFPGRLVGLSDAPSAVSSVMLPLLDILNHRHAQPIFWRIGGDAVDFVAQARIVKGEQVFSNYGNKSNAELLFSFGFCLRPNAADVVVATLGCPGAETLALTDAKLSLLADHGLPCILKSNGSLSVGPFEIAAGEVPAMLCTAAAICLLQDQKEEPEFSEDEVETLQALFRTKLDAITSSQSADLLLLGEDPESSANGAPPVPPARLYAAMYRQGQREVLGAILASLDALLAEVETGDEEDEDENDYEREGSSTKRPRV